MTSALLFVLPTYFFLFSYVGGRCCSAYGEQMFPPGASRCAHCDVDLRLDRPADWLGRCRRTVGGEPPRDCVNDWLGSPSSRQRSCRSEAIVVLPKASDYYYSFDRRFPLIPLLKSQRVMCTRSDLESWLVAKLGPC